MTERFDEFRFLWPARPTSAVTPDQLGFFELRSWVAQPKMNGTCSIVGLGPGGKVELWNRHNETLRWSLPADSESVLRQIAGGPGWTVFVAELLHSKVSGGPKDLLFLHDALVWNGEYLLGETYMQRYERIVTGVAARQNKIRAIELSGKETQAADVEYFEVTSKLWLAGLITGKSGLRFRQVFESIKPGGVVEGLVLKNPDAKLEPCVRESSNSGGSAKVRYPTKSYSH